ncbi:DUF1917-domain-containing protein [Aspergillus steynii IBT 23096]|uniref:DUF1917-domain-containing protein n=1 Tax=Aspergillus steynii IBT 23096 TaxID=1392250 RepID=A0A2I2GIN9_9EURO|nr:DUF1917-domain-containing protein [Aspergillus steynii IBT 23096]PLB52743.1 DUF1917-domain-containing protein [Aspergillus steynii IBT 23096]
MPRPDKPWYELSDESSFYGNDEEVSHLEELVRNNAVVSSSPKRTRKSTSRSKPVMSGDSDFDVEVTSPPRERSSRKQKKGIKTSSTGPKSTPKVKKESKTSESKGFEPAENSESAPEPAKISPKKKIKVEDPESTDTDSSAPEPKKKSSTKKRKADSSSPAVSDSAPPPKKKSVQKRESPESTDSGPPSPSPPREQSPDVANEPETNPADESTESPEESDSDPDKVQTNQPLPDLTARIPPSTSNIHDTGPWIYVMNPRYQGPQEPNGTSFWAEASETILNMPVRRQGGRGSAKEMNETRRFMEQNILCLARRKGIVMGKWMFFLTRDRVDYFWNVIAQATERGELGPSAKVATDDGSGKARLLAVYTRDFEDVADVRRVAQKLAELGLIKPHDRPIYYKTNAYTLLDINSNNPWGLKASMYNSRDMLARRI